MFALTALASEQRRPAGPLVRLGRPGGLSRWAERAASLRPRRPGASKWEIEREGGKRLGAGALERGAPLALTNEFEISSPIILIPLKPLGRAGRRARNQNDCSQTVAPPRPPPPPSHLKAAPGRLRGPARLQVNKRARVCRASAAAHLHATGATLICLRHPATQPARSLGAIMKSRRPPLNSAPRTRARSTPSACENN